MQQINLYLPEFRPKRDMFSAINCLAFIVLTIFVVVFTHVDLSSKVKQKSTAVVYLDKQTSGMKARLAVLKKTPIGEGRDRIQKQIESVRVAIKNRQAIAGLMSGQTLGNSTGFSRHMKALSQFSLSGLFLQEFEITKGGEFTRLKGVSKEPDLVPLYLSGLRGDTVFSNTKFGYLLINNMKQYVSFTLTGEGLMDAEALAKSIKKP